VVLYCPGFKTAQLVFFLDCFQYFRKHRPKATGPTDFDSIKCYDQFKVKCGSELGGDQRENISGTLLVPYRQSLGMNFPGRSLGQKRLETGRQGVCFYTDAAGAFLPQHGFPDCFS